MQNYLEIEKYLIDWIKNKALEKGVNNLILEGQNCSVFALLLHLCYRTQIPTTVITDKNNNDIIQLASEYNIKYNQINISKIIQNIQEELKCSVSNEDAIALSVASYKTHKNGIVVGARCRHEHLFTRPYSKLNVPDLLPFALLKQSQLECLSNLIIDSNKYPTFSKIKETSKETGLNITSEELEWLDDLNERTKVISGKGLIEDETDPTKSQRWYKFTVRQKEIIAKLHQIEKLTRHKHNPNIPVCSMPKNLLP